MEKVDSSKKNRRGRSPPGVLVLHAMVTHRIERSLNNADWRHVGMV